LRQRAERPIVGRKPQVFDALQPLPPGAQMKTLLRGADENFRRAGTRRVRAWAGDGRGLGLGLPKKMLAILGRWLFGGAKNENG
jgi:hypothetical protein